MAAAAVGSMIAQTIAAELISRGMSKLFDEQSPYEQQLGQQMGIGQQLLPQLQAQAAGRPSIASRAQEQRITQLQGRAQQSYAASARSQAGGLGVGATPARAQQGRLQAAGMQAQVAGMGALQQSAQAQLGGMYQQAMPLAQQGDIAAQASHVDMVGALGRLFGDAQREPDELTMAFRDLIMQQLQGIIGTQTPLIPPGSLTPSTKISSGGPIPSIR